MVYAVIKNDVIINTIEASPDYAATMVGNWDELLEIGNSVGAPMIGWVRSGDGDSFEPPA